LLVNLDQRDKMKIEFSLPEIYIKDIKIGDTVQIQSEPQIEGKISAIESRISENSRSIMVQVVADNKDGILNSGQFVDVIVPISREKESVMVPDQSLIPVGGKVFIYKVENGTAKKSEVKIGIRTNKESEILTGVNAGDVVVTAGHQKLMMAPVDGLPVRVSAPTQVESSPMAEEKEIGIGN
jgi:membrane fusion protein (multidrug efflux system)